MGQKDQKERLAWAGGCQGPGLQPPPPWEEVFPGMPARSFSWQGSTYIHQCRIDVVAGFSIHRDEEGQAAVQRQDIHAPILIMVPGQETDAAVLGPDARSHDVEGLWGQGQIGRYFLDGCPEQRRQQCSNSLHPPSLSVPPVLFPGLFSSVVTFYHLLMAAPGPGG